MPSRVSLSSLSYQARQGLVLREKDEARFFVAYGQLLKSHALMR
jgi:hypothetical protein